MTYFVTKNPKLFPPAAQVSYQHDVLTHTHIASKRVQDKFHERGVPTKSVGIPNAPYHPTSVLCKQHLSIGFEFLGTARKPPHKISIFVCGTNLLPKYQVIT